MKKLLGVFIFMLFVGAYSITAQTVSTTSSMEVVDKDKCPKCGSDKCDGKCDIHAKKGQATTDRKSVSGDAKSAKACCSQSKKAKACAKKAKTCAKKSKASSKESKENEKK